MKKALIIIYLFAFCWLSGTYFTVYWLFNQPFAEFTHEFQALQQTMVIGIILPVVILALWGCTKMYPLLKTKKEPQAVTLKYY